MPHHAQDLITLFEQTFFDQYNTRLIKGGDEPLYSPASVDCSYHQIIFAHGYFTSALHEISHWCLAGEARRQLEDFGYWYLPDGRNAQQQKLFEQVEIKPQAIEWAFCLAANIKFNVSVDNLSGEKTDDSLFRNAVYQQAQVYCREGFPVRAQLFIKALTSFYNVSLPLIFPQPIVDKELITHV